MWVTFTALEPSLWALTTTFTWRRRAGGGGGGGGAPHTTQRGAGCTAEPGRQAPASLLPWGMRGAGVQPHGQRSGRQSPSQDATARRPERMCPAGRRAAFCMAPDAAGIRAPHHFPGGQTLQGMVRPKAGGCERVRCMSACSWPQIRWYGMHSLGSDPRDTQAAHNTRHPLLCGRHGALAPATRKQTTNPGASPAKPAARHSTSSAACTRCMVADSARTTANRQARGRCVGTEGVALGA